MTYTLQPMKFLHLACLEPIKVLFYPTTKNQSLTTQQNQNF